MSLAVAPIVNLAPFFISARRALEIFDLPAEYERVFQNRGESAAPDAGWIFCV